jgi:hypothetical protein
METGVPLKSGQGWVKRWTTATAEDELAQARAVAERYYHVEIESRHLPPEQAKDFRFEQMRQFRTQYRENFLRNR